MVKSFKKFMEEEEGILSSYKDILDISPDDIRKEPFLTKFNLGTNLGAYRVLDFKRNSEGKITHAVIKVLSRDKTYKGEKQLMNRPKDEGETKIVSIKDLDKLLGQDFQQQPQA
jgi:hypothetical protein